MKKTIPSEEQFKAYVMVQQSGKYNMLMDAEQAMVEADLDKDTYFNIIANYSALQHKYCTSEAAYIAKYHVGISD